jgi:hypothetical protein
VKNCGADAKVAQVWQVRDYSSLVNEPVVVWSVHQPPVSTYPMDPQ